jgi:hypothetical protein
MTVLGAPRTLIGPAQYQMIAEKEQARAVARVSKPITGQQVVGDADLAVQRHFDASVPGEGGQLGIIPMLEVGRHSITASSFTYGSKSYSDQKDPVNVIWYQVGSAWDVQYDMQNWVRNPWSLTTGATQYDFISDAVHTGGKDDWRQDNYQLNPVGSPGYPQPREHIRVFQSWVSDSHSPSFGWWSVGDAHHDNLFHTCADEWDFPRAHVQDTFRNAYGNYLWFVGNIYYVANVPPGAYQCANTDGQAVVIDLTS